MKNYKLVGLTGQSGAGKSTVANLFRLNGHCVIDADKLVAELYAPNSVCIEVLAALFGVEIITIDGELDRKALAEIVFSSPQNLKLLNSVIHPFVMALFLEKVQDAVESGETLIVYDAPQLFESRSDVVCDVVVSVTADNNVRLQRICTRDDISEEKALERINAQYNEKFFVKKSDFIIKNNGDLIELEKQFNDVYSGLV